MVPTKPQDENGSVWDSDPWLWYELVAVLVVSPGTLKKSQPTFVELCSLGFSWDLCVCVALVVSAAPKGVLCFRLLQKERWCLILFLLSLLLKPGLSVMRNTKFGSSM